MLILIALFASFGTERGENNEKAQILVTFEINSLVTSLLVRDWTKVVPTVASVYSAWDARLLGKVWLH